MSQISEMGDGFKPITLHYSEELIRSAVFAFWWRMTGWRYFIALILSMAAFALLLLNGERSWLIGVFGSCLVVGLVFPASMLAIHYRTAFARLRRMKVPEARFEIGDERFRVTSDVGSTEMVWSMVKEVWSFPHFWLLFFSQSQFITLPLADLDDESRAAILDRVKKHGSKVRQEPEPTTV